MKLTFFEQTIEVENTMAKVDQAFASVNEKLAEGDYVFSHLMIDGQPFYNEFEEYIAENVASIQEIEVVVKTTKEMINEILLSTESYLQGALPEIEKLVDEFYNNPTEQTWVKYEQLLEGIHWIVSAISAVDQTKHEIENWNEYLTKVASLQNELQGLSEAMENQDYVLLADIIQYEIMPILEAIKNEATTTIDNQGERPNLS